MNKNTLLYYSLHTWQDFCARGTLLAAPSNKAMRENPVCHSCYEFLLLSTFVALHGTI